MSDALLRLEGVSSGYGQSRILWDVDFALPRGKATALIGRNGVGKSTLLSTIMGLRPLISGRVLFDGRDISRLSTHQRARAGIALVPQGRHVFPFLTVEENLLSGLAARRDGRRTIPGFIFDLFPKLDAIRHRKGGLLSGGEQQQLAIGRALAGDPRLLLLDEPTEGIQPNVVAQIEDALRHVRSEMGMTILVVEQYLDFAWRLADLYAAMQCGRIVRSGDTGTETADTVAHLVHI
ncbi:ABC transporter ATP-binding protein [Sphingobium jiangsuense]|uniref:Urea transport system ATP-binding protein n=1 Tax=Sphingobium jiangsuense TaxID=870476 RepID=A0A7W6BFH2_9SPHN|nr:urea ABC transporter ATP-binding subunit UrtE [Sphingobium jiangsuense]MBB3926011.1 urea transport system ATP-binding protein [Sphingobium jiangsuense]GLS98943.1 ABC transporter ATP-binding protein [Sphingobium jiangsuense]